MQNHRGNFIQTLSSVGLLWSSLAAAPEMRAKGNKAATITANPDLIKVETGTTETKNKWAVEKEKGIITATNYIVLPAR